MFFICLLIPFRNQLSRYLADVKSPFRLFSKSFHNGQYNKLRYATGFLLFPITKQFLLKTANCERLKLSHKSRVKSLQEHISKQKEARFNWSLLWELMKPDLLWFIFASVCAFGVAIVNIKIPILLGDLINSITSLLRNEPAVGNIFDHLYQPCKNLILFYLVQSSLTFFYITSLSCFGERLACRMRILLFQTLMEQDVAFFDQHKTGEVINRYTISLI